MSEDKSKATSKEEENDDEIHSPDYKEPTERVGFNRKSIILTVIGVIIAGIVLVKVTTFSKKEQTPEEIEKAQNQNFQPMQTGNVVGVDKLQSNYANKPEHPVELVQQGGITTNQQMLDAKNNPNMRLPQQQPQDPYQNANYALPDPNNYQSGTVPSQQPQSQQFSRKQAEEELRLKREYELKQRHEDEMNRVRKGSLKFGGDQPISKASNSQDKTLDSLMSTTRNNIAGAPGMPEIKMPDMNPNTDPNKQKDKQAYLDKDRSNSEFNLRKSIQYPTSPYQIMAGTILPSTFITGLKSDLPGQIIGQIRENVYDSVRGKYMLIPQGTRIIGEYSSAITSGQDRVLIVWTRLILPNGGSINLEGMPGVDLSGYAGVSDKVDYHFLKIASGAILSSLLGAGVSIAGGNNEAGKANFGQLAANGAASKMNDAGGKIMDRFLDQQPTIQIRPGMKFNVFVNKDIIMHPYRN